MATLRRIPLPIDALRAHRATVVHATGYLNTMPPGDPKQMADRAEARIRNEFIIERLNREIAEAAGEEYVRAREDDGITALQRVELEAQIPRADDYKSYGRADW